jgi:putative ABC transport system permease protein
MPAVRLALVELRDPMSRVHLVAIAATGAIAVFGSVAIQGAERNLKRGLNRTSEEWGAIADLWVSPAGVNNTLGTTPFPASASTEAQLRHLPGVASVGVYRGSFLNLGDRRVWVIAPSADSAQLIPTGQLVSGDPAVVAGRLRQHGWAVISETAANERHLHGGMQFMLPSPVPHLFRVAALGTNSGWPPGVVVINADDYAQAWNTSAASAYTIDLRRGVAPSQGLREVQRRLGRSGLVVQTAAERARAGKTTTAEGLSRLTAIGSLVLVAAILAMGGVMSSMMWQRRRRSAYVKRQGFTRALAWRALLSESSILLAIGCSAGAAFGLYGQILISHALAAVTGFPVVVSAGVLVAVVDLVAVWAAALAIVAIPGYLTVRARVMATADDA